MMRNGAAAAEEGKPANARTRRAVCCVCAGNRLLITSMATTHF